MNTITAIGQKYYALFLQTLKWGKIPFLLFVRLYWGWMFAVAGYGKLTHLDKTAEFFATLNLPMPYLQAILAASVECFGGALLMIGLGSRLVSLPLAFTMIVAYVTTDPEALRQIFSDPDKFYGAAPFTFLMASLVILFCGPGKASADYFIKRRLQKGACHC